MSELAAMLADSAVLARRNLVRSRRLPGLLLLATGQPVAVALFLGYVIGPVLALPGVVYRDFLLPGVFTQAVMFAAGLTAVGLAQDRRGGALDRFRALPVSRWSVLLGHVGANLCPQLLAVAATAATAAVMGWRIETGAARAAAGFAVLLAFGQAVAWVSVMLGLAARTPVRARRLGLAWTYPFVLVSCAFLPTGDLPGWLRPIAQHNPVSVVATALRALWLEPGPLAPRTLAPALLWTAALLALTVPTAHRLLSRRGSGR
ncbi:transport permease protein [Catellatospora sp. TT07R-123]|uniref:ABC transporter permease n=1 Tax=Catellatospora sp. TT07R-123 TaxID=2733863 RepID=UPI001B004BB8|nr:ABC transporter permease [Catellatospora sp. TT07R-123]GHJ50011.1 transport permease protein [Catellatospora sp. TT07R-123]